MRHSTWLLLSSLGMNAGTGLLLYSFFYALINISEIWLGIPIALLSAAGAVFTIIGSVMTDIGWVGYFDVRRIERRKERYKTVKTY